MEHIEENNIEHNEIQTPLTNEELIQKYENDLITARENYKKASGSLQHAGDSFEEECIKDDMEVFKKEVKSLRAQIDSLMEKSLA